MKRSTRSRRAFLRLLATGSAATLATPVAALAAEVRKSAPAVAPRQRRARTGEPVARTAAPEEIEKQKKSTAESLGRIRAYALPPGSPPSFTFRPLAPIQPRRRRG